MANPEHFDFLYGGKYKWNDWRRANPQITPDLSNINFNQYKVSQSIELREFDLHVPRRERLTHRCTTTERKRVKMRYYRTAACKGCDVRSRCTESKRGRLIKRLVDEEVLERMARRLKDQPEKMKLRQQLVEHPYGTMKRGMNQGYFLLKGIKKVAAEMSLTALCYNMKRVLNILGIEKMMRAVG